MSKQADFIKFAQDFVDEVTAFCDVDNDDEIMEDQCTGLMLEFLNEAGETVDGTVCPHRSYGMQLNGYSLSEDEECLDLIASIFTMNVPPVPISRAEMTASFKRLTNFFQKVLDGNLQSFEKTTPVHDLVLKIQEIRENLSKVRFILITNGIAKVERLEDLIIGGFSVSCGVWDIERLFRCWNSGRKREVIEINFEKDFGGGIPCLVLPEVNKEYNTYLAVVNGNTLAGIYGEFGPRLLERNVRSFLQARGKVNKGILNTIKNEAHMFLAYSNGISITAESVEIEKKGGGAFICSARDLQIVNGGQTTASIYHAAKNDKADVSGVFVQAKITVLNDPAKLDKLVPFISEYANTQNKVQTPDFKANDPFHVRMEELSRTVWAPAVDGFQKETRWFYERARGQYLDEKSRESTLARKKAFEVVNPVSQKFTKTDLAKFENTWSQLPHFVSRGAEKNFREFTVKLKERSGFTPDQKYFEHLVAKAILFKRTEKLVDVLKYGGYRANIVTYTLAWLSHETAQRIDLDRIWKNQKLTTPLEEAIIIVSKHAHQHVINPPNGGNITEWCKKEDCWKKFSEVRISIPETLMSELKQYGKAVTGNGNRGIDGPDERDKELILKIMQVSPNVWFEIAAWAKQTNNLASWQRGIAFSMGKLLSQGKEPSRKQAIQGEAIVKEALKIGFKTIP